MFRDSHLVWMKRCLELAQRGRLTTPPNPMVGCVITKNDEWVAEGFHRFPGGPHAEVIACAAFTDKNSLSGHRVYVSLEPCSHVGRTPPCTDLLLHLRPDQVIVACTDPDERVSGRGIKLLQNAGIDVIHGVLQGEAGFLMREYMTHRSQKRPYIILKWAQTSDGFIDAAGEGAPLKISSPETDVLVHRWRAEVQGIVCGSTTWKRDNPALTVRHVTGSNPQPFCLSSGAFSPEDERAISVTSIPELLSTAMEMNFLSLLIEGGSATLNSFINAGVWDEIRMISGVGVAGNGVKAPELPAACLPGESYSIGTDKVRHFYNSANLWHRTLCTFDTTLQ